MYDIWMRRRRLRSAQCSIPEAALAPNIFVKAHLPALPTTERYKVKVKLIDESVVFEKQLHRAWTKAVGNFGTMREHEGKIYAVELEFLFTKQTPNYEIIVRVLTTRGAMVVDLKKTNDIAKAGRVQASGGARCDRQMSKRWVLSDKTRVMGMYLEACAWTDYESTSGRPPIA
ncbi:hypothetical protein EVAR_43202_1 [Eumeta japonica]|uniref:Uncharacterized protein n=1 Tax=Eumeta variegata TaxID=151549 RepID=A0A4C1WVN6_EUMVA|nr:hypothetical protein EVAR_43202_1 [Eumeta japonica]